MKNCDVCGTLNFKKNNYCTHCGCKIVKENICPFCGQKNPDENDVCIRCHKAITPVAIDSFDRLFSEENISLLSNTNFSKNDYCDILRNMFKKLDYVTITGKTSKEKVLQIANVFTTVVPKSSGVVYGEYGYSVIKYDDRLDESFQTSTIIHELAHFLLFDLCVNVLCEILDVKSNSVIKAFVQYFLSSNQIISMNEYCAHTVENRFIPLKYQRFNSFHKCILDLELDDNDIEVSAVVGNSFAKDFIHFLEKYIDRDLRESIKLQFKMDMVESEKIIDFDVGDSTISHNEKNMMLIGLMEGNFKDLFKNKEARKELIHLKDRFED